MAEAEIGRNERRLKHLHAKLKVEQTNLKNLQRKLDAETLDVERLEGMTLHALFYALLGRKKEQLETERYEALQAHYAVDHCQARLDGIRDEITEAQSAKQTAQRDYASRDYLLKQKAALLKKMKHKAADDYYEIEGKVKTLELRELQEAIRVGKQVQAVLTSAIESLNKATDWGRTDMMGGGVVASSRKHSHIDRTNEYIKQAERLIGRFERELADLDFSPALRVQIDEFDKLADRFFDNLFSDWRVQKKLVQSLDNLRTSNASMRRVVDRLIYQQDARQRDVEKWQKRMEAVLESAE